MIDEITAIFPDMGFSIAEGPDIETDWFNFTALNFPEGHPAREMRNTFFMAPSPDGVKRVLRTHTSPVQICTMMKSNEAPSAPYPTPAIDPPIRAVMPGRTPIAMTAIRRPRRCSIRSKASSSTRSLYIGQLRWVLEEFLKAFFEVDNVTLSFRPSFFPFNESSMEVDVQCDRSGSGSEDRRRQ